MDGDVITVVAFSPATGAFEYYAAGGTGAGTPAPALSRSVHTLVFNAAGAAVANTSLTYPMTVSLTAASAAAAGEEPRCRVWSGTSLSSTGAYTVGTAAAAAGTTTCVYPFLGDRAFAVVSAPAPALAFNGSLALSESLQSEGAVGIKLLVQPVEDVRVTLSPFTGHCVVDSTFSTGQAGCSTDADCAAPGAVCQPTGRVSSLMNGSLTFTASNWNVLQTARVKAAEDSYDELDVEVTAVRVLASSANKNFDTTGLCAVVTAGTGACESYVRMPTLTVSALVTDNDASAVVISPTSLAATEGGSQNYTIRLATKPLAAVTVTVATDSQVSASTSTVTISPNDWNTPVAVTVTAVDDAVVEASPHTGVVSHTITSTDGLYNGLPDVGLNVSITDNDAATIVVSSTNTTTLAENGGTATFTVKLGASPTQDVQVVLTSSHTAAFTATPAAVRFTSETWNLPATITMTAVDNDVVAADVVGSLVLSPSTADPAFGSALNVSIPVVVVNDDVASLKFQLPLDPMVFGEGTSDGYQVSLGAKPASTVVVDLSASVPAALTLSPANLTFTPSTWSTPQSVTVASVDDAAVSAAGYVMYAINHTMSGDAAFGALAPAVLPIKIVDNDVAGVQVSATNIALVEGASTAYRVVLASQPTADVVVALTGYDGAQLSFVPATPTLTFTPSTWDSFQQIVVTAVDDAVAEAATATYSLVHTVSSDDSNYNATVLPLTVQVTDDDTAGVAVSTGSISVTEGSSATYNVTLVSNPGADVNVTLSAAASSLFNIENCCTLTFTAANWNVAQGVRVNAVENDVDSGTSSSFDITAATTSAAGAYNNLTVPTVTAVIVDNDSAGLSAVLGSTAALAAGVSTNLTVALSSRPLASVTVTLLSSTTRLALSNATLTFTVATWDVPRVVTLTNADTGAVALPGVTAVVTATARSTDTPYDFLQTTRAVALGAVVNDPPVASAGLDRVSWVGNDVSLDASGSTDPESGALTFAWRQTSGTVATIDNAAADSITVSGLVVGQPRSFEVTVTDNAGLTSTDTAVVYTPGITASPAPTSSLLPTSCVRGATCQVSWAVGGFPLYSTVTLNLRDSNNTVVAPVRVEITTTTAVATRTFDWSVPSSIAPADYALVLTVEGAFVAGSLPTGTAEDAEARTSLAVVKPYAYAVGTFGACSTVCGAGVKTRTVQCTSAAGATATDGDCSGVGESKPAATEACNPRSCDFTWVTRAYGDCDQVCDLGTKTRTVECQRFDGTVVPSANCTAALGTTPATTSGCSLRTCTVSYSATAWSACSATCGTGVQTRTVTCRNELGKAVDTARCASLTAVPASQTCFMKPCGGGNGWRTSAWSTCNATCAGGVKTRDVTCVDASNNPTVGCDAATRPAASVSCNRHACETFQWVYTPYGACSAQCGGGSQSRHAVCASSSGYIALPSKCSGAPTALSRTCNLDACPAFYWKPTAWSACSASCGTTGVRTRTRTCVDQSGDAATADKCSGATDIPVTQDCNRYPCAVYVWQVSPWGACSATCGGTRTRTVSCYAGVLAGVVADSNCAALATKPSNASSCSAPSCDFCSSAADCSYHGTCTNGACVCDAGYSGDACRSHTDNCPNGVYFPNGATPADRCCVGVIAPDGTCCSGSDPKLDATGACCPDGVMDACGVCGGSGIGFDVTGQCCTTSFDAQHVCCNSAQGVDACGVCAGQNSCQQQLVLSVTALPSTVVGDLGNAASQSRVDLDHAVISYAAAALNRPASSFQVVDMSPLQRRLLADAATATATATAASTSAERGWTSLFKRALDAVASPHSSGSSSAPRRLAGAAVSASLLVAPATYDSTVTNLLDVDVVTSGFAATTPTANISVTAVTSSAAVGMCGNGVCELGEACAVDDTSGSCCPRDCAFSKLDCPAVNGATCNGRGACVATSDPAVAACSCFTAQGYTGADCTSCATGFQSIGGVCVVSNPPSCFDGAQNGNELGVDCGGDCAAVCYSCSDGVQNGDETGVDCGGSCPTLCTTLEQETSNQTLLIVLLVLVFIIAVGGIYLAWNKHKENAARREELEKEIAMAKSGSKRVMVGTPAVAGAGVGAPPGTPVAGAGAAGYPAQLLPTAPQTPEMMQAQANILAQQAALMQAQANLAQMQQMQQQPAGASGVAGEPQQPMPAVAPTTGDAAPLQGMSMQGTTQPLYMDKTGEGVTASPGVADGVVYMTGEGEPAAVAVSPVAGDGTGAGAGAGAGADMSGIVLAPMVDTPGAAPAATGEEAAAAAAVAPAVGADGAPVAAPVATPVLVAPGAPGVPVAAPVAEGTPAAASTPGESTAPVAGAPPATAVGPLPPLTATPAGALPPLTGGQNRLPPLQGAPLPPVAAPLVPVQPVQHVQPTPDQPTLDQQPQQPQDEEQQQ